MTLTSCSHAASSAAPYFPGLRVFWSICPDPAERFKNMSPRELWDWRFVCEQRVSGWSFEDEGEKELEARGEKRRVEVKGRVSRDVRSPNVTFLNFALVLATLCQPNLQTFNCFSLGPVYLLLMTVPFSFHFLIESIRKWKLKGTVINRSR